MKTKIIQDKFEQLLAHVQDGYAPNTVRAYRTDFSEFILYAEKFNQCPLPANPDLIANFLLAASNSGIKNSTVLRKVGSISAIHRFANLSDPTKHPEVKLSLRKIARRLGTKFDQAYPIDKKLLEKMLAVCSDDLRGRRNKMLLLLAYESLRRRAELVSLRVEDIEFDESARCAILLRKSKTDQSRSGHWIALGPTTTKSIVEWLEVSKITNGFLLRGIRAGKVTAGFDPCLVNRIFKKLASNAGAPASVVEQISGHSTRVGCAQDMLKSGASMLQLMVKGGWSKPDTVMRYIGKVSSFM